MLEHDTAGDPMSGLRWCRRTTVPIAEELSRLGIAVSPNTVARLLHQMGYSLHVNSKKIATGFSPDRNLQFNFKNPGRRWDRKPQRVFDHDFRTDSIGVAIPNGIYDVQDNRGALIIGCFSRYPAFAHAIAPSTGQASLWTPTRRS